MARRILQQTATTWERFDALHGAMLRESSKFEYLFFKTVLCQVPNLRPEAVVPQFQIKDSRGRSRYIDFVVKFGPKPRLALEVDGYDKTGSGGFMSRAAWDDFNYRQNEVVLHGMTLLRFSNMEFSHRPLDAIKQIENAVNALTIDITGNLLANGALGVFSFIGKQAGMFKDGFEAGWEAKKHETIAERERVRAALKEKYGLK